MEELTKTQIVLLTLLVSFVTSLATGIVTVALVDQSSQGVGQTIQTVVEKTIETVIPGKATSTDVIKVSSGNSSASALSESDLVVRAVSKNSSSIVRIKQTNTTEDHSFIALGLIISKNGTLITDKGLLYNVNAKYEVVFPDGKEATMTPATLNDSTKNIAVFTVSNPGGETFNSPVLGDSSKLSLGQKLVSISGSAGSTVNLGIFSNLDKAEGLTFIKTDFDVSGFAYGSILMNLNGDIVGMKTGAKNNEFLSSNDLKKELGL